MMPQERGPGSELRDLESAGGKKVAMAFGIVRKRSRFISGLQKLRKNRPQLDFLNQLTVKGPRGAEIGRWGKGDHANGAAFQGGGSQKKWTLNG